jgi:hypothetical protein
MQGRPQNQASIANYCNGELVDLESLSGRSGRCPNSIKLIWRIHPRVAELVVILLGTGRTQAGQSSIYYILDNSAILFHGE